MWRALAPQFLSRRTRGASRGPLNMSAPDLLETPDDRQHALERDPEERAEERERRQPHDQRCELAHHFFSSANPAGICRNNPPDFSPVTTRGTCAPLAHASIHIF